MAKHTTLAQFEFFVLLAVELLGENPHGGDIRRVIEERADRPTSLGAVYATLGRLEDKGLIVHDIGPSTPVRGGRGRKLFHLTEAGVEELRRTETAVRRMLDGSPRPADL